MIIQEQTLPEKLKMLRRAKGYSQDFVAKKINITRQGYQHYESGRREPDTDRLIKLAELYHLQLFDLVSGDIELKREDLIGEAATYSKTGKELEQKLLKFFRKLNLEDKIKLLKHAEAMSRNKK